MSKFDPNSNVIELNPQPRAGADSAGSSQTTETSATGDLESLGLGSRASLLQFPEISRESLKGALSETPLGQAMDLEAANLQTVTEMLGGQDRTERIAPFDNGEHLTTAVTATETGFSVEQFRIQHQKAPSFNLSEHERQSGFAAEEEMTTVRLGRDGRANHIKVTHEHMYVSTDPETGEPLDTQTDYRSVENIRVSGDEDRLRAAELVRKILS